MIHDLDTLVDRQFEHLLSRDGSEFFLQLRRCLRVLESEPRAAALLEELRQEALELDRARKERDVAEIVTLIDFKRRFLELAPDAGDSAAAEPTEGDLGAQRAWFQTLAAFDAVAAGRRKPWREDEGTRGGGELLRILAACAASWLAPRKCTRQGLSIKCRVWRRSSPSTARGWRRSAGATTFASCPCSGRCFVRTFARTATWTCSSSSNPARSRASSRCTR